MDGWSIALWVVAGYVAVVALMRLMAHKRNEVMAEFHGEVEKEKSAARPRPRKQANASRARKRRRNGSRAGRAGKLPITRCSPTSGNRFAARKHKT